MSAPDTGLADGRILIHIRHGETDWNAEARLQGESDVPINARGRDQARRNGARLAEVLPDLQRASDDMDWLSSPLSRARETMEIVRSEMGLDPAGYRTEDRVRELAFGKWRGHTIKELKSVHPDAVRARRNDKWGFVPPGGESYEDLKVRVGAWLARVDRDSVVVAHGGVYRVLHHLIVGTPPAEAPALHAPQDRIAVFRAGSVDLL